MYPRLSPQERKTLLSRVVARCNASSSDKRPVVVFDLDGTLLDNRPRTTLILREWADKHASKFPEAARRISNSHPFPALYLVRDTLKNLGVEDPDALAHAEAFWKERFFQDAYLEHDVPIAGAVKFAQACHEGGAIVVYFTGRDLPNMSLGSWASLRDAGFPIGVAGTELVLKPRFEIPDEHFKRDTGPTLARLGEVVATFDNEPGNCNLLLGQYNSADHVFVDTQHFPGAPKLLPDIPIIESFVM